MTARDAILAAPNINALWSALLVEELVRQGVGLFVISPGSRSAPLALAVVGDPRARWIVHVDERGGAFAALGHARATGRPAAVVTTSGTALANTLPAAVEADQDGVPLLILSADRPPELRETAANQTIRQPGLLAGATRWMLDVPTPAAEIDPAFVLTTAAQVVHRSLSPPGPVHLNLMFREPLAPETDGTDPAAATRHLAAWLHSDGPYTQYRAPTAIDATALQEMAARVADVERGLIIVGKTDDPALAAAAGQLGAALGWPVLADIGSGLRLSAAAPTAAPYYDVALASERVAAMGVEAVVHLGGAVTSKRLSTWLALQRPAPWVVVRRGPARVDPTHAVTDRIEADPAAWAAALASEIPGPDRRSAYFDSWARASEAAGREMHNAFRDDALTEPRAARIVAASVPPGGALVTAASMPVRDLDAFAGQRESEIRVAANRGASGIDGTVATAAGYARGAGVPTALLIGDLALLHDLNSLGLLREEADAPAPPVVVVVINNDGGGIFSFLPVAAQEGVPFEPVFGTPHGLGFEDAARMYGLPYSRPAGAAALAEAMQAAFGTSRPALIEVRTERSANRTVHGELVARVAAAVDAALSGVVPTT